jgi:hypothetical protein
MQREE